MLEAQARHNGVLARQPTGSGKTLSAFIPAVAAWLDGLQRESLPPLTLGIVPWRALAFDLEREVNEYLAWVAQHARPTVQPRALFIDRQARASHGTQSHEPEAAAPFPVGGSHAVAGSTRASETSESIRNVVGQVDTCSAELWRL